jgi:hypothetical protein
MLWCVCAPERREQTGLAAPPRAWYERAVGRLRIGGLFLAALVLDAVPLRAADLGAFARCLTRARTTYYRTSWCPHCRAQEELFGSAMRYIDEVDCTAPRACAAARVASFPTWTFADGSRLSGLAQPAELSRRTGCPLSGGLQPERGAATHTVGGVTTRERIVGGMQVIEIPGR